MASIETDSAEYRRDVTDSVTALDHSTVAEERQIDIENNDEINQEPSTAIEPESEIQTDKELSQNAEQKVNGTEEQEEEDDDDFGSFSDASFDDFEEPQQETKEEQNNNYNETTADDTPVIKFPQSTFNEPDQLKEKLEQLVELSFPGVSPSNSNASNGPVSILNERSEHLLERLTSLVYLKPYSWQKSSLRKQMLVTLGISDTDTGRSNHRRNEFDADQYVIKAFSELNITDDEKRALADDSDYVLSDYVEKLENIDDLSELSEEELSHVIEKYNEQLDTVEKLLSLWEDERVKLQEDNNTFEGVVENLVGHTQRIRREETFKSLQKEKEKSKGISSIFRKKKK
jgi:hypothetical protein